MLSSNILSTAVLLLPGLLAKGLVILLVVAIAANQLRRASAAVRHAAWTAGIVSVLALPVTLELGPRVHLAGLAQGFTQSFSRLSDAARTPMTGAKGESQTASSKSGHGILDGVAPVSPSALPSRSLDVAVLLFIVWVIGALVLTGRDIGRSARAHRLIARSRGVRNASVLRLADELRNRFGIGRPVLLVESDEISGPATFGIFRPVVLLPKDAGAWPLDTLHTVLAHELAHVARRDCLTDAIALAARNVHWLNPMAWVAVRRMRLERERACDDRVLEMGVSPEPYATLLLNVARAALREAPAHRLSRTAALAMAAPLELESRLLAIFDPKLHRGSLQRGQRFGLAAIAAATSLLIAGLRLEAAPTAVEIPVYRSSGQANANARVAVADFAPTSGMLAPTVNGGRRREVATAVMSKPQDGERRPQVSVSEPDTRRDSVAHPRSERISSSPLILAQALRGYEASRDGPDSLLARTLRAQLDRVSQWEGDLVRERSAWALARVRNGRIIEPMVDELRNADWRARAYAAWVLDAAGASATRDRRATMELVAALSHPVWRLRAMAAQALSAIGDPAARGAILGVIDDEAWQVRVGAVNYVASLGDPQLISVLERKAVDRHIAVSGAASEALAAIRTQKSSK